MFRPVLYLHLVTSLLVILIPAVIPSVKDVVLRENRASHHVIKWQTTVWVDARRINYPATRKDLAKYAPRFPARATCVLVLAGVIARGNVLAECRTYHATAATIRWALRRNIGQSGLDDWLTREGKKTARTTSVTVVCAVARTATIPCASATNREFDSLFPL